MQIPSVPNPNYVNPPMRPSGVEDSCYVLIVLCVVVVALRIYTKYRILRSFGLDDLFAVLGMVCTIWISAHEVIRTLESHAD